MDLMLGNYEPTCGGLEMDIKKIPDDILSDLRNNLSDEEISEQQPEASAVGRQELVER